MLKTGIEVNKLKLFLTKEVSKEGVTQMSEWHC